MSPLTRAGLEVMSAMSKKYGKKKAKEVFYAMINSKKPGTQKWEKK